MSRALGFLQNSLIASPSCWCFNIQIFVLPGFPSKILKITGFLEFFFLINFLLACLIVICLGAISPVSVFSMKVWYKWQWSVPTFLRCRMGLGAWVDQMSPCSIQSLKYISPIHRKAGHPHSYGILCKHIKRHICKVISVWWS